MDDGSSIISKSPPLSRSRLLAAAARRGLAPLSGVMRQIVNVVLPPVCPVTGDLVDEVGHLVPRAWRQLQFITAPMCRQCGRPFPFEVGADVLCGPCTAQPPPFDSLRSVLVYDDISARLVLRLKYGDQTDGLRLFAKWMAQTAPAALAAADYVVPVPLHYIRLVRRQFNQSAVLARALTEGADPVCPGVFAPRLLRRVRRTPPQKGLKGKARWQNVKGAFNLSEEAKDKLKGQTILLVDDVFTTGATIYACCQTLRRAQVDKIHVVTLARVAAEDHLPI